MVKPCECEKPGRCLRHNTCMIGHLYWMCQHQPERMVNFARGKRLPEDCGKDFVTPILPVPTPYAKELTPDAVPPPVERFGTPPTSWTVGITTAPRKVPTVDRCVESIRKAGWGETELHLFSEPGALLAPDLASASSDPLPMVALARPDSAFAARLHPSPTKLGPWRNFARMIAWLAENTATDAYLICQDDALFFSGPVRDYLENHVLWISPDPHVCSLYTSSRYLRRRDGEVRGPGWHILGRGGKVGWWGAVAFVLSREALLNFAASDVFTGWLTRRKSWLIRDPATIAQVDTAIGFWGARRGGLWTPLPSLVQHVGDTSTIYRSTVAKNQRRADWMLGGPPPLQLPTIAERMKSATVSLARWAKGGFEIAQKTLRKNRLAICESCDRYRNGICMDCGCVIELKAMMPHESCSLKPPKWVAVTDEILDPIPCGGCGHPPPDPPPPNPEG